MRYVKFAMIEASLPPELRFTEAQLLKIGRQVESPLPYIRESDRNSAALWETEILISWLKGRCRKAPQLASEFERNLRREIARAKAGKK